MYVIVIYDSDPEERKDIRAVIAPHLHWIQNSAYAGELNRVAALDLADRLKKVVKDARITFWLFDRKPETIHMGTQDDNESIFL